METLVTPVLFRASARLVAIRLIRALGLGVLAAIGWWSHLTWLPGALAVVGAAELLGTLRLAGGRTEVDGAGIRVTRLGLSRRLPWSKVIGCEVRTTLFGRSVRVTRSGGGRSVRLAVPASPYLLPDPAFDAQVRILREQCAAHRAVGAPALTVAGRGSRRRSLIGVGLLLVVGLLLDQPWGWPTGPTARSIPDPCPLTADRAVTLVGPIERDGGTVRLADGVLRRACEWDVAPHQWLLVSAERYRRLGLHSGTWRATVDYAGIRHNLEDSAVHPMPRLADESIIAERRGFATVVARRGNVLVTVIASGTLPHYDRDAMLAMAEAVVNAIQVG